ncbi:MAG: polysaccharide biosynthesis/export family protein [Cyclobacteriaceae bacterium]|nr:polysaccharide biosynthesis/export family protein [Cyclobacteriaceae bacterium]
MFQLEEDQDLAWLSSDIEVLEKQYVIKPNDLLNIRVYTNKGERIIDPNFELQKDINQNQQQQQRPQFQVFADGSVKFPMVDTVKIAGMNLREAEQYLSMKYNNFYKDAFVTLEYLNKRVVVLGAPGGKVIPLENENTSIIEVIALAGGIDLKGKAQNIRLIRGDLHHPQVFLIDLSTIEGMRTSMTSALPGDIVYIEPNRKIVTEGMNDFMTIFSVLISTLTLVTLIVSLNNQ